MGAPTTDGRDQLAKDTQELQQMLVEIKESIRTGQQALNELSCGIATEVFKRRGVKTDSSLRYLGDDVGLLLSFIECMIINSKQVGGFVSGHPNASHSNPSSPIGDLATLRIHDDFHFKDALAKEKIQVDDKTRGLYDPATRSVHLPDNATFGQALHEGVHAFSSIGHEIPAFTMNFGSFLYEGMTQLFTDMILSDHSWNKAGRHEYEKEVKCATKFRTEFGPDLVGNAYFRRQVRPLIIAVTNRLRINSIELQDIVRKQEKNDLRRGHVLCERLGYM